MTYNLSISETQLERLTGGIASRLDEVKRDVQEAMAEQFRDIVMSNFGPAGTDRPFPWPALSDRSEIGRAYIKKVGRSYATLYETGKMAQAVKTEHTEQASSVILDNADCPYATRHHWGDKGESLPIRRVFPIKMDGQITDYTKDAVMEAAVQTLQKALA
tara:strand:+ start:13600 stop:14079 length:480 start_codon:yes stop_codon:yes gene_type:complete